MQTFFIISIILFIFLLLIKRYRIFSICCILFIFLILLLTYPNNSLNAAKEGINLWLFIVIPSLLPFFIINDMLSSLKVPDNIAYVFSPIAKRLFKTSGYGAYAFIMSIFAGYPSGARIVSSLVSEKKITNLEGEQILTFSSTSGPLFILGAVGSGMLLSPIAGYIILISHILSAILNGVFSRFLIGRNSYFSSEIFYSKLKKPKEDILSSGIISSLITSGYIGGYIILFCVIVELLNKINFFGFIENLLLSLNIFSSTLISNTMLLFESSIELSNGCKILSSANISFEYKLIFLSFLISFSGFAIIGQVSSVVSTVKLNMKKYVFFKFTHGILASFICFLILKFNIFNTSTFSTPIFYNSFSLTIILISLLIIIFILNIIGYTFKKVNFHKKNRRI